ncbi:unnamed protein product [Onchocerca flexuosa]|uniref:Uncharacterized protein n=1 Tax=Onchocerca flexuosa TaxID=387005 RepID=A0A183HUH5_9BILA|nr:unnamed protein product [Onchocerca flexuosa]
MNINTSLQTTTELPATTEAINEDNEVDSAIQVDPAFDQIGSNRLQNFLEMDLPRPKALLSHHKYGVQNALAGKILTIIIQ